MIGSLTCMKRYDCHLFLSIFVLNVLVHPGYTMEVFIETSGFSVSLKKSESVIFQANATTVQIDILSRKCHVRETKTVFLDRKCHQHSQNLSPQSGVLEKWYTVAFMDCNNLLIRLGDGDDNNVFPLELGYRETNSKCEVTELKFSFIGVTKLAQLSEVTERNEAVESSVCSLFDKGKNVSDQDSVLPGGQTEGGGGGGGGGSYVKCTVRLVTSIETRKQRKLIFGAAITLCLVAMLCLCYLDKRRSKARMDSDCDSSAFAALTFYSPAIPRRMHADEVSPSLMNASIPAITVTCPLRTDITPFPYLNTPSRIPGNSTPYLPRNPVRMTRVPTSLAMAVFPPVASELDDSTPIIYQVPDDNTSTSFLNVSNNTQETRSPTPEIPGDLPPSYDDIEEEQKGEEEEETAASAEEEEEKEEEEEEDPPSYWEIKRTKSLKDAIEHIF